LADARLSGEFMDAARVSGKKLIWFGAIALLLVAISARIFAIYYLRDMPRMSPDDPATTQSSDQSQVPPLLRQSPLLP
jgi:hypothetical protein